MIHDPMCKPLIQFHSASSGNMVIGLSGYSWEERTPKTISIGEPRTCICQLIQDIRDDTLKSIVVVDKYTDKAYIKIKSDDNPSAQTMMEVDAILDFAADGSVIGVEVFGWPQE